MNNELSEVIKTYATKPHKDFSGLLLDKSKDQLISLLSSLLTIYINDRNSSTIREFITVSMAGYAHQDTKIGYNGFKQSTEIGGKTIACEAKPQNLNTADNLKRKNPRKLNGGGNFTDYTHKRLKKDLNETLLHMLVGGFVDGELIYILEFPFSYIDFVKNLQKQLKRRFPSGDKSGQFLRSASFSFEHYKNYKNLRKIYLKKQSLEANKQHFTKNFYNFLLSL